MDSEITGKAISAAARRLARLQVYFLNSGITGLLLTLKMKLL